MKYIVTAQSFNAKTGKPTANARAEVIDTATNELFASCKNILDVHDAYESFWNRINSRPKDLVFVASVVKK